MSKTFTIFQLRKFNGQNGNPPYIAVDGVVYDVSNATAWENGLYHGFEAGNELSHVFQQFPHGKNALNDLPVVGKIVG